MKQYYLLKHGGTIMRKRRFMQGSIQHIYQRSIDKGVIFYHDIDRLVFYTLVSKTAELRGIKLLGICLMPNHFHLLGEFPSSAELSSYMQYVTSVFAHEYNRSMGRKGSVFHKAFGSAPKKEVKQIRTAIAYLFNNPVEKQICSRAEEYRWNFLAYLNEDTPFSEYIPHERRSFHLQSAMRMIRKVSSRGEYLGYVYLNSIFQKIRDDREKEYLKDYIIKIYGNIELKSILNYFEDYEKFLIALHANTGSEYDLKEDWDLSSDKIVEMMNHYLEKIAQGAILGQRINPWNLDANLKIRIGRYLHEKTGAGVIHLSKFLHLNGSIVKRDIIRSFGLE